MMMVSMSMQNINREATRKNVEEWLESVRLYRRIGVVRRETQTTRSYEARYHGTTNTVSKAAEAAAVWNVDQDQKLAEREQRLIRAMEQLAPVERELVQLRYLEGETFDYTVYGELHISERKYYRVKWQALFKLALMLGIEEYL